MKHPPIVHFRSNLNTEFIHVTWQPTQTLEV